MGPSDAGAGFVTNLHPVTMSPSSALTMELPKPENWAPFKLGKFKKDERQLNKKKQHFQSRPLVDFQKDLEAGKVRYVTPRCWPPIFFNSVLLCCNLTQSFYNSCLCVHGKPSVPCNVCQAARSNGRVAAVGYSSEYGEAPSPFLLFISSVLIQCVYLFYRQYEQREGGTWTNKDVNVGYVPSGMSVHEWHEFKRAENKQTKNKNFAAIGPTSFKSRSLQGQYQ